MDFIDKIVRVRTPIIIFANYRTGSSALARHIAQVLGLPYVGEPSTAEHKNKFHELYGSTNQFVAKFIATQVYGAYYGSLHIYPFAPARLLLHSDCYKIKLQRQNKAEQIASYYIAQKTEIWFEKHGPATRENYDIVLDRDHIKTCVIEIAMTDEKLDNLPAKFDQELYYENLGILENTDLKTTTRPGNYAELLTTIEDITNND